MEEFELKISKFPTKYTEILHRLHGIDPKKYGSTRNYINGAVTYLSPYISRGVISTKFIFEYVLEQGYDPKQIKKFIQELAWRDYWQQVWLSKGEAINEDLKHKQSPITNFSISKALIEGATGVFAIDKGISELYETGYLHNHLRMYIASIACNMAQSHWLKPAQWMYYHLLDADWASNALSWQWVAGSNSNKKYVANQENINTYCYTSQKNTFLDVPYDTFKNMSIPEELKETTPLVLKTVLPEEKNISLNEMVPTLVYNMYNIDPLWKKNISANRVLLLEPSHFSNYPISQKSLNFIIKLATDNIKDIVICVGEFKAIFNNYKYSSIYYKEHPLNRHYMGIEEPRDWMFDVRGYYPSFFAFWKRCEKKINY